MPVQNTTWRRQTKSGNLFSIAAFCPKLWQPSGDTSICDLRYQTFDKEPESDGPQSNDRSDAVVVDRVESKGATILVADDERLLQQVTKRILESMGHRVLLASDGPNAVEMVTQYADELDLVVMDVMMPNLTGTQAEQQIHRLCPDLPVIFCTGHAPGSEQGGGLPQGCAVLRKPFQPDELLKVVQQTLQQSRG